MHPFLTCRCQLRHVFLEARNPSGIPKWYIVTKALDVGVARAFVHRSGRYHGRGGTCGSGDAAGQKKENTEDGNSHYEELVRVAYGR